MNRTEHARRGRPSPLIDVKFNGIKRVNVSNDLKWTFIDFIITGGMLVTGEFRSDTPLAGRGAGTVRSGH